MTAYRCYLIGEDGKIRSAEVVECPTDDAALAEAGRRLADRGYPEIEVWDRARRVGNTSRSRDHLETAAPNPGANPDFPRPTPPDDQGLAEEQRSR